MIQYEITFIVDPVLSGDEIKATAQTYVKHLEGEGCKIVHVDEMGLRQLAYAINKRTSGVYFCIEFEAETGELISKLELALRRDERVMRFLTVRLDKYGVKYNEDKRNGKIGKVKKKKKEKKEDARGKRRDNRRQGGQRQGGRQGGPRPNRNNPRPKPESKSAAPQESTEKKEN